MVIYKPMHVKSTLLCQLSLLTLNFFHPSLFTLPSSFLLSTSGFNLSRNSTGSPKFQFLDFRKVPRSHHNCSKTYFLQNRQSGYQNEPKQFWEASQTND